LNDSIFSIIGQLLLIDYIPLLNGTFPVQ